jgi:uncharacterized membrane protein
MNWSWVILFVLLGGVMLTMGLRALQSGNARYAIFSFTRRTERISFWATIAFWLLCSFCLFGVAVLIAVRQSTI